MNKWVYRIIGLGLAVYSIFLFIWFYSDFQYSITHLTNLMYFARIIVPWVSLYLGIFYFYFGVKNEKINKNSNASLWVLILSLVISVILLYGALIPIGSSASSIALFMSLLGRIILPLGIIISIILSIISLFRNKKTN